MYGAPQGAYDPNMGYQQPMQPVGYDPNMGYQQPMQPVGYDSYGQPIMGQQPMGGMYDPQMAAALQAQDQAAAELAALEQAEAARNNAKFQREVDHVAHKMRHGNRNQEDNASCATMLCFWGILNGLLFAVPLLGDNWWNKTWHGLGVRKLEMTLGTFNMNVYVDCDGYTSVDPGLCKSWTKYGDHGPWALAELRDEMCKQVPEKCHMIQRVVQSGYIPLYTLPAAAGFEVLGILILYLYWHGKPTALARNMSLRLCAAAPIIGNLGFFGWLLWCPYMHELPRIWAQEGGNKEFANNSFFGMKESFSFQMGWCCLMLMIAVLSSTARFFVQWTMPFHIHESDPLGVDTGSAEAELRREAEKVLLRQQA